MSYGFAEQKAARQRRWRIVRWTISLCIFLVLGVSTYWSAARLAESEVTRLEARVDELAGTLTELRDRNAQLQAETEAALRSEADWQARYKAEVPTGDSLILLGRVNEQLGKGADPERIAFLIDAAAQKQKCDAEVQTKRFLVRTPLYEGANISVSFANNAIVVSGEGETGSDAEGKPEAWFDQAKPVTLQFAQPGGETSTATGLLPLHHSVVRGDNEHRFTIMASDSRGFITVTAERCAFP